MNNGDSPLLTFQEIQNINKLIVMELQHLRDIISKLESPARGAIGIGQVSAGHLDLVEFQYKTPGDRYSCRAFPGGTNNRNYKYFWPLSTGEVARLIAAGCPIDRE